VRAITAQHEDEVIHAAVDAVGRRGCRYVVEAINRLELNEVVPELTALTAEQRADALAELKAVMAVYDTSCDSGAKVTAR
jgi:hypothetical protein